MRPGRSGRGGGEDDGGLGLRPPGTARRRRAAGRRARRRPTGPGPSGAGRTRPLATSAAVASSTSRTARPRTAASGIEQRALVGWRRLVDRVGADGRAAQVAQVRSASEQVAEVGGQRADVGAAGARHLDGEDRRHRPWRGRRSASTVTGRAARSTSMPSRASSCSRRPSTSDRRDHRRHLLDVTGEVRRRRPGGRRRASPRAMSCVATTAPSASSESVSTPSTTSPVYRFQPSPTKRIRRVTSPTPTTSTPVALGSSVPAWPIRRSPRRRRSMPTTSWLVTPAGLSTIDSPWTVGGRRAPPSRRRRAAVGAIGAQDVLDALGGADDVVGPEVEDRRLLRPHLAVDRRLDAPPVLLEDLADRRVAVLAVERVEVDDGPVHLVVDVDGGDGHERQPLVVDLDELLGDHLAQGLAEAGAAGVARPTGAAATCHPFMLGAALTHFDQCPATRSVSGTRSTDTTGR